MESQECWSVKWLEKYGNKEIQEITKKSNKEEIKLEIEYQLQERERKLFYKWKKELRIYTADKLGSYHKRFDNIADMNQRLIGMQILEDEKINKVFQKWKQRETIKLERLKQTK